MINKKIRVTLKGVIDLKMFIPNVLRSLQPFYSCCLFWCANRYYLTCPMCVYRLEVST